MQRGREGGAGGQAAQRRVGLAKRGPAAETPSFKRQPLVPQDSGLAEKQMGNMPPKIHDF